MKFNIFNTLQLRIIVSFIVLILIIILSEFIAYNHIKSQPNVIAINSITQALTRLQKDEILLKSTSAEFILREKNNLSFFETGESKFLKQYQQTAEDLGTDLRKVESLVASMGFYEHEEVSSFRKSVEVYDTLFRYMVSRTQQRGYAKYGIIGEFDHSIMDLVRHDFGVENVAILNLQLYVKDYLLSGNKGTTNNIANEIYNFSLIIEKYVKEAEVESVITALSNYESSFEKLVAVDDELGTYSNQGLAKQLFSAGNNMDAAVLLPNIQDKINNAYRSMSSQIIYSILVVTITAIIIALLISLWLNHTIVKPFGEIKIAVNKLGTGEIPGRLKSAAVRDLNEIVAALNNLIQSIRDHHEFADQIRLGNFTATLSTVSEKDVLGAALINMRNSLHQFDLESKQRNKINQSIAQFAAILRNNKELHTLGQQLVSKIARDLEVQYVGFYLIQESTNLELVASYGFDKSHLAGRKVDIDEGTLGQSIQSKESIHLASLPKHYHIKISSGLGQATPNALLITPLISNDRAIGAIEIASFSPIEEFHINFLEAIAANIAGSINASGAHAKPKSHLLDHENNSFEGGAYESFFQ